MQKSHFVYSNEKVNVGVNKMPIWFKESEVQGNEEEGSIKFVSQNDYDEIWGPNARMELSWERKGRAEYFHAREVQSSIDMFNAIQVVVTDKENNWINSHEFTYWFGNRTKMVRKRYYPENIIHGVFYCDMTERQFNISAYVIRKHYDGFKPYILEGFNSIVCH
ncbi:MAG: hypothetical protein EU548_01320 [Promethearchaeota archaeon]|nr:MAG: hypothetical protein EU548_01320 [Candidatus Lokiarchaeota archaeon]